MLQPEVNIGPSGRNGGHDREPPALKDLMFCNSDHCHALLFFKEQSSSRHRFNHHLKTIISTSKDK